MKANWSCGTASRSTKRDKDYHGYGMLSIRRIVEKYGGNFTISTEDQLFQIDIMLPIPAAAVTEK